MLQPLENTVKEFFDRFGVRAAKLDSDSAVKLLASEIYLHHISKDTVKSTAKLADANQASKLAEAAEIVPKRRGRNIKNRMQEEAGAQKQGERFKLPLPVCGVKLIFGPSYEMRG